LKNCVYMLGYENLSVPENMKNEAQWNVEQSMP
jgi:hypothetical protein